MSKQIPTTVILFLFSSFFILVNPHARSLLNPCLGFLQRNNKKQSIIAGVCTQTKTSLDPSIHRWCWWGICTEVPRIQHSATASSPCFHLAVHCCPTRPRRSFLPHLVSRLHPNHLISTAVCTGCALACISTLSYRHQCLDKCCGLHYGNVLSHTEQTGSAGGAAVSSSSTMSFQSPRT